VAPREQRLHLPARLLRREDQVAGDGLSLAQLGHGQGRDELAELREDRGQLGELVVKEGQVEALAHEEELEPGLAVLQQPVCLVARERLAKRGVGDLDRLVMGRAGALEEVPDLPLEEIRPLDLGHGDLAPLRQESLKDVDQLDQDLLRVVAERKPAHPEPLEQILGDMPELRQPLGAKERGEPLQRVDLPEDCVERPGGDLPAGDPRFRVQRRDGLGVALHAVQRLVEEGVGVWHRRAFGHAGSLPAAASHLPARAPC
jgi:hypothetical protein